MKTLNRSEHSESKGLFGICIFAVPAVPRDWLRGMHAVVKKGLSA
jgi:hypothetical protein